MKKNNTQIIGITLATMLVSMAANNASAQSVAGWGLETGFQNATLTEGSTGSFSVTAPSGNAAPRASISPVDFSLVGESVELSGSVAFGGIQALGNQSFRFGLFNNNGNALGTLSGGLWSGATTSGWLGYVVEAGNGNGLGSTISDGRNGTGSSAWLSTSTAADVYNLTPNGTQTGTYTSGTTAIFTFDLTLTRLSATSVGMTYSLIDTTGGAGSDYSVTGSVVDNGGASSAITSFDAVGFLLNGSSGGAAAFSDVQVQVSVVPEPSILALSGLGLAGLIIFHRRNNPYKKI